MNKHRVLFYTFRFTAIPRVWARGYRSGAGGRGWIERSTIGRWQWISSNDA